MIFVTVLVGLVLVLPVSLSFGLLRNLIGVMRPVLTLNFLAWYQSPTSQRITKTLTVVDMAPNIQSPLSIPGPEEDERIRCALLGCGMVRTRVNLYLFFDSEKDSFLTL